MKTDVTVKDLTRAGWELGDAEEILAKIKSIRDPSDRWGKGAVDEILDFANEAIDGHGVEALHESDAWVDRYYGDIIALYVNMDQGYGTLLFDTEHTEFHVTRWEDWYEGWEARQLEDAAGDVDRDVIVEAAARAFFVMDWADRESEAGRNHPGEELTDIAPDTSKAALAFAKRFVAAIEKKTGRSIEQLYASAAKDRDGKHRKDPDPEDFGFALAMQGLGTGVAWADDHPDLRWSPPRVEFFHGEGSGV